MGPGLNPHTGPELQVLGAVLCGGRSSRFGSDKALADAGGRPMALRVVDALREAGIDPVVAVGGGAGAQLGLPTIADRDPGAGPLAALATILLWARTGLVVVAPCDLPLLGASQVRALVRAAGPDRAAVAMVDGDPEPSLACWPAAWGSAVQGLVDAGRRSWRSALDAGAWHGVPLPPSALADADTPAALEGLLAPPGDQG